MHAHPYGSQTASGRTAVKLRIITLITVFIIGSNSIANSSGGENTYITIEAQSSLALKGILTVPKVAKGPFPAILLLEGSGKSSQKEETAMSAYRQIAMKLAEAGFASLRFNKRGTGYNENNGDFKYATLTDNYNDALAALNTLKNSPEVDSGQIFVLGQSMGGTRAARLAVENPDLLGVILVATPTRPFIDVNNEQLEFLLKFQGVSESEIAKELDSNQKKNESILNGTFRCSDYTLSCKVDSSSDVPILDGQTIEYWNEVVTLNQVNVLSKIVIPSLVIQGTSDWVVSVKDAALAATTFEKIEHSNYQVNIINKFDHFFASNDSKMDSLKYMVNIKKGLVEPKPVHTEFLQVVVSWMKKQIGRINL